MAYQAILRSALRYAAIATISLAPLQAPLMSGSAHATSLRADKSAQASVQPSALPVSITAPKSGFSPKPTGAGSLLGNLAVAKLGLLGSIKGALVNLVKGAGSYWGHPGTGGGGATPVPEPSMLVLFGAGAMVPLMRSAKRKAEAKS